jgi:2-dehydro-3-deoxy-D-arabinonate dehydratase
MKLYQTDSGPVVVDGATACRLSEDSWDALINRNDLLSYLQEQLALGEPTTEPARPLAPIGGQEVWAAGVTYFRSRDARMEESQQAGGGSFYDRVYSSKPRRIGLSALGRPCASAAIRNGTFPSRNSRCS